jgi:GNAT superfamily N-acetyltransferase
MNPTNPIHPTNAMNGTRRMNPMSSNPKHPTTPPIDPPAPQGWGAPLGEEDGLRYWACTSLDRDRKDRLARVVIEAWKYDYRDRAIFKFDSDYVDWLTPAGAHFLVVATDEQDEPVGCELAIDRQLRIGGELLRVSYVTLLTVHPALRGRGVAQRLLDHLTSHALARGSELLLSVFDSDAGGEGTVKKFLRTKLAGEWDMRLSRPFTVWAATPDLAEAHRYEPLRGAARAALWPGLRGLLEAPARRAPRGRVEGFPVAWVPDRRDDVAVELVASHGLSAMYPTVERAGAGSVRCVTGSGQPGCGIAYHVPEIMRSGAPDRRTCQIQLVHTPPSSDALTASLRAFNDAMFARGILGTFLANTAGLSPLALLRASFLPTERKIRVALRGPRGVVQRLGLSGRRWALDML